MQHSNDLVFSPEAFERELLFYLDSYENVRKRNSIPPYSVSIAQGLEKLKQTNLNEVPTQLNPSKD